MKQELKPLYRPLNPKERDMLFSFYEKWDGNIQAMIRDSDCIFKSRTQIGYYKKIYGFDEQLVHSKTEKCKRVLESLSDQKAEAIQRAYDLLKPYQKLVVNPLTKEPLLDQDGQPIFVEIPPSFKQVKTAWEIIKVEMGEAIHLGKTDVTSGGKPIQSNVIVFENFDERSSEHKTESKSLVSPDIQPKPED